MRLSRKSVVKEVVEEKETTEKKKEEVVVEGKPTKKKKKKSASDEKRELMEVWNEKMVAETENAGGALSDKSSTAKVKETIRTFNKHYLHLVQVEEERVAKEIAEFEKTNGGKKSAAKKKSRGKKSPKKDAKTKEEKHPSKRPSKRPDLKVITKMMQNNEILYPGKRIGSIPGIEVGYQFYSRAEMVAVGFHSHWLNGIDFIGKSYSKMYKLNLPVAVAIVISGMYEDDLDNAEDVVYTGQGGHNLTGNKRQIQDQKLERGNLALKNCCKQEVPVRVIRGHNSSSSYTRKVYTYDGLYKVDKYWADKGLSGFTVYKFRLRRVEGQPTLTTNQVYFTMGRVPQSTAEIRGLICEDITNGQETVPIPATNLVDDPPVPPPPGFKYLKSLKVAKSVRLPVSASGCKCNGKCIDPNTCECAKSNGSEFPYVSKDGGRLIEAKDVVFECGPNCGCGPECVNRTSQRGLQYRLEVFRTAKKGWAVRSWDFIPSGAPVCEYTGILGRTEDVDCVLENNYIFEIDCLQTIKGLGGRERRSKNVAYASSLLEKYNDQDSESAPEFCIDAGSTGNVARFINHCCEPNLFVQCVLSTHYDLRLARVVLFAADNIPPLQELTYDYGYALDSVLDSDGKVKQMACYCGAAGCRKRLF
ncbi:putative histone-lysine N-methyltransferase chromatin remodeling SET family [Medicago truncatula]|uniref:Putative histone-lysine N-methyltransferase chromatin remodeling SET family n=2 Tax=Medicago truncatula TaxID=3880 RepID=A0A396HMG3_MEDTR|nr:putative histone-lysine N-methyltransferase chromatin remodeling SET family [Medicago truncatula]